MRQFEPMLTGWFAHKRPFAFEMGPIDYADDVWRYSGGTPAMPALYTAWSGWEIVSRIGVQRIRERSLTMTRRMMERCDALGFRVNTPREDAARGGTVCFDFDGAEAVSKELIRRGILLDYRPKCGIRASPHFYTTDDEVERLFEEIGRIRAGR
jgi:kynureninase